ncbi:unnamed protein product [Tuber aestivum]|uniref:60S acidic ribosomal protein P2 n=1 Tax=Tuber aestivum TaxID=59557 RepID=A0A292PPD7_9PEZI|nr:unnamed protein product [Tuber aestivum]
MKHLAAYLLLGLSGNTCPSAEDIKVVLGAAGIDADEERLSTLLKELEGKDINELITEGTTKLASVPTGGSGGGGASGSQPLSQLQVALEGKFANEFHRSPRRTWVSASSTKRSNIKIKNWVPFFLL